MAVGKQTKTVLVSYIVYIEFECVSEVCFTMSYSVKYLIS